MSTRQTMDLAPMSVWLWLGSVWLWIGMALCPVNQRIWNPGKYYHQSLALLYLPPLAWLCWQRRHALTAILFGNFGGRCLCALLLWAALGQVWSNHGSIGDGLVIEVGVLLFVLGTAILVNDQPRAWWNLQFFAGVGIALTALLAMLAFPFRDVVWEGAQRLVAFGTWNNPNLAGMGAGAALLWLWLWPVHSRGYLGVRAIASLLLLVFIAWTYSRASWLALAAALLTLGLLRWKQLRLGTYWPALLFVSGLLLWHGWRHIVARGWSYRPQIFSQALDHIVQAPWLGIGTLSRYQITVAGQHWEHSHNVWTHLCITLGLPGLLLWTALWLWTGYRAWQGRRQTQALAVLWIYGSVATQFDAPLLFTQPDVEWALLWLPIALALGLQLSSSCQDISGQATATAARTAAS